MRAVPTVALVSCLVGGCVVPQDLQVLVHDEPASNGARATVSILRSCADVSEIGAPVSEMDSQVEVSIEIEEDLGRFEPGPHAAYAMAFETPCGKVRAACENFDAPVEGSLVEIWLQATPAIGCGVSMQCVDGTCLPQ
jgi:hypothetical protein